MDDLVEVDGGWIHVDDLCWFDDVRLSQGGEAFFSRFWDYIFRLFIRKKIWHLMSWPKMSQVIMGNFLLTLFFFGGWQVGQVPKKVYGQSMRHKCSKSLSPFGVEAYDCAWLFQMGCIKIFFSECYLLWNLVKPCVLIIHIVLAIGPRSVGEM